MITGSRSSGFILVAPAVAAVLAHPWGSWWRPDCCLSCGAGDAVAAKEGRGLDAGVVRDEVEVWPVPRRLGQVGGVPSLRNRRRPRRQALVDADIFESGEVPSHAW